MNMLSGDLIFQLIFLVLVVACGQDRGFADERSLSAKEENTSVKPPAKSSVNNVSFDGFYLNDWNNSGVLIIHQGKIHHFNRNSTLSMYKDEEYDFKGLHANGKLHIHRSYRLDRNDELVSKETLLTDILPLMDNDNVIAVERNGRTFHKLKNLKSLFEAFDLDIEVFTRKIASRLDLEKSIIDRALIDEEYYIKAGLPFRKLRDGDISFEMIFETVCSSH